MANSEELLPLFASPGAWWAYERTREGNPKRAALLTKCWNLFTQKKIQYMEWSAMRSSPPDSLSLSLSLADINNTGDQPSRHRAGRSEHGASSVPTPAALCGRVRYGREERGYGSAGAVRCAHLVVLAGQGRAAA